MPLLLVTVTAISGGGFDAQSGLSLKKAVSTEFFRANPPEASTPTDAGTAAIITVPVDTGAARPVVQKWTLSITLSQLITAINAVEAEVPVLGDALTAIDALTPEANALIYFTGVDSAAKKVVRDGILDMLGLVPAADKIISFTDADNAVMLQMGAVGKAILLSADATALKTAGAQPTSEKNAAGGYVGITAGKLIELPNSLPTVASTLSSADDTVTRGRKFRDASGEVAVQYRGTGTFVAGQLVLHAAAVGAANAAMIAATSQVRLNGISALNASPALGVDYTVTIVAGTSITIDMYDAAGAAAVTDVATRYFEVSF